MRSLLPCALMCVLPIVALAGPVRDHRVVAELVPVVDAIVPGETFTVCLNIKHDPKWHTYWKNPGLAGVPTKLIWDLPDGFEAGPIQWARPQRVKMAIYNTFGYEDEVTLLVDIQAPASAAIGDEIELKAKTTWMMCAETCHPSSAKLSLTMPVAASSSPNTRGSRLAAETRATMPVENDRWETSAKLEKDSATLVLTQKAGVELPAKNEQLYFFSDDGLIDSHPEQTVAQTAPGIYKLSLPRAEFGPKNPTALTGVLLSKFGEASIAYSIRAEFAPEEK
ncbi:MAG: protein-disulfide reductase DsbD domain-containing protein [Verrucomicrobiales bacterium]